MPTWLIPPHDIIEPVPAPEIYIDDIGAIELGSAHARIFCIAEELCIHGGGVQRTLKVVLRRPRRTICHSLSKLALLAHYELSGEIPLQPDHPAAGWKPRVVT